MKWTNETPIETGFYWAKQWAKPQVVEVAPNLTTVWVAGHNVPVQITEFYAWSEKLSTPED